MNLSVGESKLIETKVTDEGFAGDIIVKSSDNKVVSIETTNDGYLAKANSEGVAVITVQAGNKRDTIEVSVGSVQVEEIVIENVRALELMEKGTEVELDVTILPANATADYTVVANDEKLTVNGNKVKAVASGKTSLTVKAGNKSVDVDVRVVSEEDAYKLFTEEAVESLKRNIARKSIYEDATFEYDQFVITIAGDQGGEANFEALFSDLGIKSINGQFDTIVMEQEFIDAIYHKNNKVTINVENEYGEFTRTLDVKLVNNKGVFDRIKNVAKFRNQVLGARDILDPNLWIVTDSSYNVAKYIVNEFDKLDTFEQILVGPIVRQGSRHLKVHIKIYELLDKHVVTNLENLMRSLEGIVPGVSIFNKLVEGVQSVQKTIDELGVIGRENGGLLPSQLLNRVKAQIKLIKDKLSSLTSRSDLTEEELKEVKVLEEKLRELEDLVEKLED